ncbi:glycosyltransferase, partial [Acinetobacter baumannii]
DGGTDQKCADSDPRKAEEARARRRVLQALCADLGVSYLTRRRNVHAKAGNLNNGLQNSVGEIVVVLDADHVPFRSFLRDTIGH